MPYEVCLHEFEALLQEVQSDDLIRAAETESDTRAKLIDRILVRALGWPEANIRRERWTETGPSDYVLTAPHPTLVVEAKRVGEPFLFPLEKGRRTYALSSLRSEGNGVGAAINQARRYADDEGIEFACATNGAQWIIFRAITPNEPWAKGTAIVFRSLEDILNEFPEFWNLLSFESVAQHSLRAALTTAAKSRQVFARALDDVLYADALLARNKLATQLQPLIDAMFGDLTGEQQEEGLRRCYVYDRRVEGVARAVQARFNDTVPAFAAEAGFLDLIETEHRSGALDRDFKRAVERGDFGTTVLLLGGVGSGKTTFIHRFFRVTAKAFVEQRCLWFYIPFTNAPLDSAEFAAFIRSKILLDLKLRYAALKLGTLPKLEQIYEDVLVEQMEGLWAALPAEEQQRRRISFLETQVVGPHHCDAVLRFLRKSGLAVTVVLDNVDQREPAEQMRVFLLAHEICRTFDAIVFVALREESFFRAAQAGAFNAYHNTRYHIATPDVRALLEMRVAYAIDVSGAGTDTLRLKLRSGMEFNAEEIKVFMHILNSGALKGNPAISQFIDAVSYGDMRKALGMFNTFMTSGVANVERWLAIFREEGRYNVAEHEFIKAVMLNDYQFYKERRSRVLNLLEVSSAATASNLTTLRLLEFLARRAGHSHPEGVGFVPIEDLLRAFAEVFGDSEDVEFHLSRLLPAQLLEADNRQVTTLANIRFVRITPSGDYYLNTLSRRFVYLDIVGSDTPIWNRRTINELKQRATATDLYERVYRAEWLVSYLKIEDARTSETVSPQLLRRVFPNETVAELEQGYRNDLGRVARSASLDRARLDEIRADVARLSKNVEPL